MWPIAESEVKLEWNRQVVITYWLIGLVTRHSNDDTLVCSTSEMITDTGKWKYAMKNVAKRGIIHHRYSVPVYIN
jgi:6-phosphogluconate dehydrogenase (decarboxylating)